MHGSAGRRVRGTPHGLHIARGVGVAIASLAAVGALTSVTAQESGDVELTAFGSMRVERMLDARVACRGCHVIAGRGGRIGPTLDGVRDRLSGEVLLAMIRDPIGSVPGTLMPVQHLPEREARRLASYLLSLEARAPEGPAVDPRAPTSLAPGDEAAGAALYARHCSACHGETGAGDGWNAPALAVQPTAHSDAELMGRRPDDALFDAIFAGAFVLDGSPQMPGFGTLLSRDQIESLVGHIRSLCDCSQPSWAGGS